MHEEFLLPIVSISGADAGARDKEGTGDRRRRAAREYACTPAPLIPTHNKESIAKANEKEKPRAEVCVFSDLSASLER